MTVTAAGGGDAGFSTKFTFQDTQVGAMTNYDFFVPSVWYRDNASVNQSALAHTNTDYYYWFREDRLPLPLFMLRQKLSGATLSVTHRNPNGSTFIGEDYLDQITDSRMQFAAIGMENNTQPAVGILFPGSEGERTLVEGGSQNKKWALRSHPVTLDFMQSYSLVARLGVTADYPSALQTTWNAAYTQFSPATYACDLSQVYSNGIKTLIRYWTNINSAPGQPFQVLWKTGLLATPDDDNYQMGFVGMQLPNAAILVREGFSTTNLLVRVRGEQSVEWWSTHCLTANGCPKTWYDPIPQTWRSYPTYLRVSCDGMIGMLWAWNQERQHGVSKANWIGACTNFGNWLISKQNADGSIARGFDYTSNLPVDGALNNTSHMIRYLVELYLATGQIRYQQAALKAGNYIYADTYQKYSYVGGTVDNPNITDKESASMALRAFNALYDLTRDRRWLDAATQTATFYATWIYSWPVPIPSGDASVVYPTGRLTTGLSQIATSNSGCDSYAATDAFEVYRLYLFTGDAQYLAEARMMLYNTKQPMNWDAAHPLSGYGDPGLFVESLTLAPQRGHGISYYLSWQTANYMEPLLNLKDTFGLFDLNSIEQQPSGERQARNNQFSLNRGYVSSQAAPTAPAGLAAEALNGSANLQWNPLAAAVFYNLKRATNQSGPFTVIVSQTNTDFSDILLSNETTYFYVVSAMNAGGESTNSLAASVTPHSPSPISANLSGMGGLFFLSWPAAATGYTALIATNLTLPVQWTPVSAEPEVTNGLFRLALPAGTNDSRFFRLRTP